MILIVMLLNQGFCYFKVSLKQGITLYKLGKLMILTEMLLNQGCHYFKVLLK